MRKSLLVLAAAALLAAPAVAQVSPSPRQSAVKGMALQNPRQPKFGLQTENLLSGKHVTGMESVQPLTFKRLTRMDDAQRSHKELSYQVTGQETNAMGVSPMFNAGTLAKAGYSGYGFVSYFPEDMMSRFVGNTITKINFVCWKATFEGMEVVVLNANTGDVLAEVEVPEPKSIYLDSGNSLKGETNSVELNYTVKDSTPLLIGWMATSCTADTDDGVGGKYEAIMPYYLDNTGTNQGAYMLACKSNGNFGVLGNASPVYVSENETASVCACITVETTGDAGLKDNDASVVNLSGVRGQLSQGQVDLSAVVANMGLDSLRSFDYSLEVDGQSVSGSYTFETPVPFYQYGSVTFQTPLGTTAGSKIGQLTITNVNGAADEYVTDDDNLGKYSVVAFENGYKRTPVIEEFTSTTCGWCPRGIIGNEKVREACDGDAVVIAIHQDYNTNYGTDPFALEDYEDFVDSYVSGFPSVLVNREASADPYYEAPAIAKEVLSSRCEANMTVKAPRVNSLSKEVNVQTTLEFDFPVEDEAYGLAYVFTEDNITSGVKQLDYYAYYLNAYKQKYTQYTEDQLLEALGWSEEDAFVDYAKNGVYDATTDEYWFEPTFNDVACSVSSVWGEENLVPAAAAHTPQTITAQVAIPTRATDPAISRSNLKLAVLLFDQTTGVIVTGRQIALGETSEPSGIEDAASDGTARIEVARGAFNVTAGNAIAEVYTADGKLVSSCTVQGTASLPTFGKGVYVIRVTENGHVTTQKATF